MDYEKFSESASSDVKSPLADRLNSSLNINSSMSETNGRKEDVENDRGRNVDLANSQTPHDSESESRTLSASGDERSVTESKQACDKLADSECDLGKNETVKEEHVDSCNLVKELVDTTECINPDRSKSKEDSTVHSDNEEQDDSDDDFVSEESGSDIEYESADEGEEIQTDKQNLQELEDMLTDEQKEEKRMDAQSLKDEGNELFRSGSFKSALRIYSRALRTCPLKFAKDRAIMYSNRGACKMRLEDFESSIQDCTKALDLHPVYMKALARRAELYEKTEKLDEALADYQKIVELDPREHTARAACMRLPDQIKERNEKLKEEMMGKLKDLGNMILRPFGLSTNNFQMNQDPNSGGYSVNFVNNPEQNS